MRVTFLCRVSSWLSGISYKHCIDFFTRSWTRLWPLKPTSFLLLHQQSKWLNCMVPRLIFITRDGNHILFFCSWVGDLDSCLFHFCSGFQVFPFHLSGTCVVDDENEIDYAWCKPLAVLRGSLSLDAFIDFPWVFGLLQGRDLSTTVILVGDCSSSLLDLYLRHVVHSLDFQLNVSSIWDSDFLFTRLRTHKVHCPKYQCL